MKHILISDLNNNFFNFSVLENILHNIFNEFNFTHKLAPDAIGSSEFLQRNIIYCHQQGHVASIEEDRGLLLKTGATSSTVLYQLWSY
jgi:hypothetical protein